MYSLVNRNHTWDIVLPGTGSSHLFTKLTHVLQTAALAINRCKLALFFASYPCIWVVDPFYCIV